MNIQTFSTKISFYQCHLLPYWRTAQQFPRKRIVLGSKQHTVIVNITQNLRLNDNFPHPGTNLLKANFSYGREQVL